MDKEITKVIERQDNWVKIITSKAQVIVSSPTSSIKKVSEIASKLLKEHSNKKETPEYVN